MDAQSEDPFVSELLPRTLQPAPSTFDPSQWPYTQGRRLHQYSRRPPTCDELLESTEYYQIPSKVYRDPYFSKAEDAPEKPREYAGLVFHLKGGHGVVDLEEWRSSHSVPKETALSKLSSTGVKGWEFASTPPSVKQVRKWLKDESARGSGSGAFKNTSQVLQFYRVVMLCRSDSYYQKVSGPTQLNPYGLKSTLPPRPDDTNRKTQNMTILSLEVFGAYYVIEVELPQSFE